MPAKMTNETFIQRAREVHGDKFDYSKVEYKGTDTKVTIICKEHGEFKQSPSAHVRLGNGCPACSGSQKLTTETFIQKAIEKHGDKFDYSKVNYMNAHGKITIICKEHGPFTQTPANHLQGQGCPTCNHGWNESRVIKFLLSQGEDLLRLDTVELLVLVQRGYFAESAADVVTQVIDRMETDNIGSISELKQILSEEYPEEYALAEELEAHRRSEESESHNHNASQVDSSSDTDGSREPSLPSLNIVSDLLSLDNDLIMRCDAETTEFFINYRLQKLWNDVINNIVDVEDIRGISGGTNFEELKSQFFSEYDNVHAYQPPRGYSFSVDGQIAPPTLMQKLTVSRLVTKKRYGNWSGTGAGKTNSFIIASREIGARLTVVIAQNSTVSQLGDDIKEVYSDSVIHTRYTQGESFDRTKYNYLILNYEKFQQDYSEGLFQSLNENNHIDFIVIDEVHNVKQRDDNESLRRGVLTRLVERSANDNTDLHVLAMSATPVINNLTEAKSLLELTTGNEYDDVNVTATLANALHIFCHLTINGLRYRPSYEDIKLNEMTAENTDWLRIDGKHLTDDILELSSNDYVRLESILIDPKLEAIKDKLSKGSIIYSNYTNDGMIPNKIAQFVESLGFSYTFYTGEFDQSTRTDNLESFIDGTKDILISTGPVTTGVDGLQEVSNKLFVLSLPWTDAIYTQLKGRLQRTGSKFSQVDVIIPQVFIDDVDDQSWSWDVQRLNVIRRKKTIADTAVDGIVPHDAISEPNKLCRLAHEQLAELKDRIDENGLIILERSKLSLPLKPELIESQKRTLGDFSMLNRTWNTSSSQTTHERLKSSPSEWYYYHTLYSEKRKEWAEVPYKKIAELIGRMPFDTVADLGCGENLLSREVTKKVHAFDHIAIDDDVTECDITNVPLEDGTVGISVLSLALMGSNWSEYIREAARITSQFGYVIIAEPSDRWEGKLDRITECADANNLSISDQTKSVDGKFTYLTFSKR